MQDNLVLGTLDADLLIAQQGSLFLGTENLVLGLAGADDLDAATAGDGNNLLAGGLENDTLSANQRDTLLGDSGNDSLFGHELGGNFLAGGAGEDIIFSELNDIISGGAGNDTIFQSQGGSLLRGGFGNDVFFLAIAQIPDTPNILHDFDPLEDTIQLSLDQVQSLSDLSLTQVGTTVEIGLAGTSTVLALVENREVADFIEGLNIFVNDPTARNTGTSPIDSRTHEVLVPITFIGEDLLVNNPNDPASDSEEQGQITLAGTIVGGLSGITYDSFQNQFYAISDDRSTLNPARFYTLDIDLSDGRLDDGDVSVTDVTFLRDEAGNLFGINDLDPEGIAFSDNNSVFISSERDVNNQPEVFEFSLSGQQLQSLPVSAPFIPALEVDGSFSAGTRINFGFESLTLTPDETTLFTANENALVQDGELSSPEAGSFVRIVQYDLTGASPVAIAQFLYETDPIPAVGVSDPVDTNGLVDLLAIDNSGTLLALERSFTTEGGNGAKIYQISTRNANNIGALDSLTAASVPASEQEPLTKTLLFDLQDLGLTLDNLEGLTFGPELPNGNPSLVIVSDDNFDAFGPQNSQFLAFELELVVDNLRDSFTTNDADLITNGYILNPSQDGVLSLGSGGNNQSSAAFDNIVGLYAVVDASGGIDLDGDGVADDGLTPGLADFDPSAYALAALTLDDTSTSTIEGRRVANSEILAGGSLNTAQIGAASASIAVSANQFLAPFVIANGGLGNGGFGTIDDFILAENLELDGVFNDAADFVADAVTYFTYGVANPDGVAHLQNRGGGVFGFEDLPSNLGISDNDFNDAVFQFQFSPN